MQAVHQFVDNQVRMNKLSDNQVSLSNTRCCKRVEQKVRTPRSKMDLEAISGENNLSKHFLWPSEQIRRTTL